MTSQAAGEKIEVLTLESVRIDDQQGGSGDSKEKQELKDLKQRGRSILQSADAPPSGTASDAAAAAAALNPAASMQGHILPIWFQAVSIAGVDLSSRTISYMHTSLLAGRKHSLRQAR